MRYSSRNVWAIVIVLLGQFFMGAIAHAQSLPSTIYGWNVTTADEAEMMSSIAGIVNRTSGEVLIHLPESMGWDPATVWVNELQRTHPTISYQTQTDAAWFINKYRDRFSGYVLYDRSVNAESVNMASSIAGVTNAMIVTPRTLSYAVNAGLTQIADARNMTAAQVYSQYGSQFNKNMIFNQINNGNAGESYCLRDYAIKNKGFIFHQPPQMTTYLANQNHQGKVYGAWTNESTFFTQASQRNQIVVASDWARSASTTSAWKVPLQKQPNHTSVNKPTDSGKHYVAFVMSDGDNCQWLTSTFIGAEWYGSPYRGNFTMNWDLSPTLPEMNPVALNYIYGNASTGAHRDYFVTAGSSYASVYPDMAGLTATMAQGMRLVDHDIISMIDTSYNASKLYTMLDDPQVMGMMYKTYDTAYKGRNGAIDWHDGKPIVSVQYSLWDGYDSARSIATALNSSTHNDPEHDMASYTIVNVHPWSTNDAYGNATGTGNPMSNLNQLVQWLDSDVEVVTLDDMFIQLRRNFGTPVVPEPSSIAMLLGVGAVLFLSRWRHRRCCASER